MALHDAGPHHGTPASSSPHAPPARPSRSPWHTPAFDTGPPSCSAGAHCPECLRLPALATGLGLGLGLRPVPDEPPGSTVAGCARCAAHLAGPRNPGFGLNPGLGSNPGAWSLGRRSARGAGAAPGATQRILALTQPQGAHGDPSPDAGLRLTGPAAARPGTASQRLHRLARQSALPQPASQPRAASQAGSQEEEPVFSSVPLPAGGGGLQPALPPRRSASQPLPDKGPPTAAPLPPAPARPCQNLCSG